MCICLPNGKFNFKFSRSHNCSGKKDGKSKRTLSLISESSEEEEGRDKLSFNHKNGTKKDVFNQNQQGERANNQGHGRQLSRDRKLPPVPDTVDFSILQINSPRKTGKNNSISSGKCDQFPARREMDDYGNVYDTEPYAESKAAVASSSNKQQNQFPMTVSEEMREIDPLYSSVHIQANRQRCSAPKLDHKSITKEYYVTKTDNDHLYSTIVKKDFNSLRKPSRPRSSIRDYPYQSLQSLNNPAPGLPVRLYKLSELAHLTNHITATCNYDVKLRKGTPQNSMCNSLRRFSQPNSVHNDSDHNSQIGEESQRDVDVLRRIQSQYNTPPIKRASLSDVRQLHLDIEDSTFNNGQCPLAITNDIPSPTVSHSSDSCDLYRHVTVRESLASLRARNALPENVHGFESSSNIEPNMLPHVYEGLYETLYYSSAEPGRPDPVPEEDFTVIATRQELPNPLPYLGQDNYLSITENPLSSNYHVTTATNNGVPRQSQDRSSVIYATTGSEVYAEISDAYLSKHYDELPDPRQSSKENGQVNNGYIGSPGTLRVLLEIQSFRHMDSDVDVSSRSTTPLHPLARSITAINNRSKNTDTNNLIPQYPAVIRHPWFLPQRSSDNPAVEDTNLFPYSSASASFKSPITAKPKPIQNHLAIMTPLMERSMEGSSMFLDDNRNNDRDVDNLYDLFKLERHHDQHVQGSTSATIATTTTATNNYNNQPPLVREAHNHDSARDEHDNYHHHYNNNNNNRKSKRIIYPSFSHNHVTENGDRNHPYL